MSVFQALPTPSCRLGESPFWHPEEAALYWCDIPGQAVHRWVADSQQHTQWDFDCEPACCAPVSGGGLLLAMRDGLWRFDTRTGQRQAVVEPPYDTALFRFNDGKADPQGRFWVGTMYEPRTEAAAALYRWANGSLQKMAAGITLSNGLVWSPDGRTMLWTDTTTHCIYAFDFDPVQGSLSGQRVFASFQKRQPEQALDDYQGRPDGAAVDADGNYWVAMYEGQRLVRLAPDGTRLADVPLPVRCATMPCFGGADLRTLFVTTAKDKRPAEELAAQPLAGHVLTMRVDTPGLSVNFFGV